MATHEAKLGIGNSTGMFFHAPAGTALPTYPLEDLDTAWAEVGDISEEGITLNFDRSTENLRNWANKIKRTIMTDHSETIAATIMDTTQEVFETILGADAVTTTAATSEHGALVTASLSQNTLPAEEAYLFIMKDDDDAIAIGCTEGQITEMDSVTFEPGDTINWVPTITAINDGWKIILDDGQTTGEESSSGDEEESS